MSGGATRRTHFMLERSEHLQAFDARRGQEREQVHVFVAQQPARPRPLVFRGKAAGSS